MANNDLNLYTMDDDKSQMMLIRLEGRGWLSRLKMPKLYQVSQLNISLRVQHMLDEGVFNLAQFLAFVGKVSLHYAQHNRHASRRSATLAVFLCLFGRPYAGTVEGTPHMEVTPHIKIQEGFNARLPAIAAPEIYHQLSRQGELPLLEMGTASEGTPGINASDLGANVSDLETNASDFPTAWRGRIAGQYPEVQNHPEQAYVTTQAGKQWLQEQGAEL